MKKEIGARIKSIRENMHLSKNKFAKLLGISGQYLGVIESGKSCLSIEKIKILCDLTNLSADYILFGKNITIKQETSKMLSKFTDDQIEKGCDTLKKLAYFIKSIE